MLIRRLAAGVLFPVTLLRGLSEGGIRILMYHRVSPSDVYDQLTVTPERFARQMAFLRKHFRVITLLQAIEELERGGKVQAGAVVTFDDGYRDNLEFALPVLIRYEIPATIFVTMSFCDQVTRHPRYPDGTDRLHLNWNEVRTLANTPGITIGSHTLTHPYLSRISDSEASSEIRGSRERLLAEVTCPVDVLCYPSGDVTDRERQLAELAGYRAAVTVSPGLNFSGVKLHALRRTEVTDRDRVFDLFMKMHGAYDPIHMLLHWRRRRSFAKAAALARQRQSSGAIT
jgi:peptidoglycan/xylan/chitin deacetylase (PgdA/CDA1 family)